jgi:biotin carboxyl carrier protein
VRFSFEVDGQPRAVDLERTGAGWVVVTGGRRWHADFRPSGTRWSLLLRAAADESGTATSRSFDVGIRWPAAEVAEVQVGQAVVALTLERVTAARRAGVRPGNRAADAVVRAPMPGRVVRVLVEVGDAVVPQQGLVVVEAMKMESELRVQCGGVVRAVHVAPGDAVDAHALLVELDA